MKIIDDRMNAPTEFKYLVIGDMFESSEGYYMKTNIPEGILNAVDLKTGQMTSFNYHDTIQPISAELRIIK